MRVFTSFALAAAVLAASSAGHAAKDGNTLELKQIECGVYSPVVTANKKGYIQCQALLKRGGWIGTKGITNVTENDLKSVQAIKTLACKEMATHIQLRSPSVLKEGPGKALLFQQPAAKPGANLIVSQTVPFVCSFR